MKDAEKRQGEVVRKNGVAPQTQAAPVMKNAGVAPVVYFDNAPAFGVLANVVEIELGARVILPKTDGSTAADLICVAHLRCSVQAAEALRNALNGALAMIEQATTSTQTH